MFQSLLSMFMIICSFIFYNLNHPLTMGFVLLLQTLLISIFTGLMMESFWFSYILFLVFLGGLLVLFIYVAALASNETMNYSFNIFLFSMLLSMILFIIIYFLNDYLFIFLSLNSDVYMTVRGTCSLDLFSMMFKLYNYPTNFVTLLLMNYLFFTLLVTVFITNFYYGPIRMLV